MLITNTSIKDCLKNWKRTADKRVNKLWYNYIIKYH